MPSFMSFKIVVQFLLKCLLALVNHDISFFRQLPFCFSLQASVHLKLQSLSTQAACVISQHDTYTVTSNCAQLFHW